MQAVRYHDHGGPDVLAVEETERPETGRDELLVEVRAAAVNPVDTYFREGSYQALGLPMTPGSDLAGVVAETDGESEFQVGDRVFATGLGKAHQGTYAEYAAVPTDRVARLPEAVEFESGAATALVGVTAWRALVDHARLEPGETCLIHGASGGVGHVAVQLAAATGAEVLATASPEYHDEIRGLGASELFDYDDADLGERVAAHEPTVILDHRLDDYLSFDAEVAGFGARVVGIGENRKDAGFENVSAARANEFSLHLMSMFNTPEMAPVLSRLATLVEAGSLSATVARRYGLDEADEAQRAVMEDSFLGKLVLVP
ncbi:NADPH:quinone reductase [Natronorarus salvus]|uniref:NADPH:quinone reductase n=1 Tax=Natronorarus salvus TaxID=3117733 RepID=UPI002F25EC39